MAQEPEKKEDLEKSLDEMIDSFFSEDSLEKAEMDEKNAIAAKPEQADPEDDKDPNKKPLMEADENGAKEPEEEDEEEGKKRGRPDDLSAWAKRDSDGGSKDGDDYKDVQHASKPVPDETTVAKSMIQISAEDMEILKKAKAQMAEDEIKKAKQEQADLIKSAVLSATQDLKKENEDLKKAMLETQDLVKAMAKKPNPRKSISSFHVVEKSMSKAQNEDAPEKFTKSEMMDAAEALFKAGKLKDEQVIELDDTGYIFDPAARALLEKELRKIN